MKVNIVLPAISSLVCSGESTIKWWGPQFVFSLRISPPSIWISGGGHFVLGLLDDKNPLP